jgi:hypothetical protein
MKTDLKERLILAAVAAVLFGAFVLIVSYSLTLGVCAGLLAGYAALIFGRLP